MYICIYLNGIGPPYDEFSPVILLQGKPLSTSHVMFVHLSHSKKTDAFSGEKSENSQRNYSRDFAW